MHPREWVANSVRIVWVLGMIAGAPSLGQAAQDGYPIAGLEPHERPAAAPKITEMRKDDAWYRRALTGLPEPHPQSFRFLEDQEAWHTPFISPGMIGPYDIRGWYQRPQEPGV